MPNEAIVTGKFVEDFRKEMNDPEFADAVLVCTGEEILCHRFVLAGRSDVFKKMFQDNFLEGDMNCHT